VRQKAKRKKSELYSIEKKGKGLEAMKLFLSQCEGISAKSRNRGKGGKGEVGGPKKNP